MTRDCCWHRAEKYYIPSVEEIREISLYGTLSGKNIKAPESI